MKKRLKLFMLILCAFVITGSIKVYAEDFTIRQAKITMNTGDSLELETTGSDKTPVWVSYNENTARVDQNGKVTAIQKGKTTIKARAGIKTSTCTVNVVSPTIKLNKTKATIYYGGTSLNTLQLKATVKGATKDVVWESSDTGVATVDSNGKVASVSEGTAFITATANGKSAGCTITVKESSIALNMDKIQLGNKGIGSSIKLTASVTGSKKNVKWVSSDNSIATVSGGKVTGKNSGTATITATANGISDTCTVTVTDGVSINEEKILLYTGETKQLKTNAGKQDVPVWSSSDESIAVVENGLVTARGEGTAIINVLCNGKTDTCDVTVKNTATEIEENTVFLRTKGTDKTYQLNSTISGRNSSVKWTSSDKTVVAVSKGKLTAKKAGTATVTATANGVSDSVAVTVEDYIPTIKLNQSSYVLYTNKGNTVALKATVDGKSKIVSWNSSNEAVATVNSKGKVTAVSEGETVISASANGVTSECLIIVRQSRVILENETLHLSKGEKGNIPVDVIGISQSIKWSTTNNKVATVKKGVVTAKNNGEVDIKVIANGITSICHINVSDCHHNFDEGTVTKAPSCTEEGTCLYTCTICGYSYSEKIPVTEHKWGEWKTVKEATETETGIQTRTCDLCGREETSLLPVLEHTHKYETIVTEPTCTEDGYTTYKCSCGDSYTDDIVPALGHKWTEWQTIKEPTDNETGLKCRVCEICKEEETADIPVLGHIHEYKKSVIEATCTEDGYTLYECSCGDSYREDIVPASGHKWTEWETIKEATDNEEGMKCRVCSVCKEEETEIIPVIGHKHEYKTTVILPTCTKDGYTTYECSCGDSYIGDIVPASGHKWTEWQIIKEPTDNETGLKCHVCEICKEEETANIPILGHIHEYKKSVKEVTCTEDGYTLYECSCGDSYRDDIVPASGHKYITTITEPTCTEHGYTTYECSCGDSYTDDFVDALWHEPSDWVITKEPTCVEDGRKERKCIRCNFLMEAMYIPQSQEHNYEVKSIIEPTNCGKGYTLYECSVCGRTKKADEVPMTGDGEHEWDYYNNISPYDDDKYEVHCKHCDFLCVLTMDSILKYREADAKVKEVISEIITDDMNDIEKIFAVNRWICLNCEYDYDTAYSPKDDDSWKSDAYVSYGMICNGKAVCAGYARAFKEFMDVLGIECKYVRSDSMNHAWNQVKLDDGWYWIDCTWNDPKESGFFTCNYFLITGQRVEDEEGGTVCDGTKWVNDWLLLFDKYKVSTDSELNSIYESQKENDVVYFQFNSESDYEIMVNVFTDYSKKYGESMKDNVIVKDKSDIIKYIIFIKNTDNVRAFFSERTLAVTNLNELESDVNESTEDSELIESDDSVEVEGSSDEGESSDENEFTEGNESSEVIEPLENSELTEEELVEETELTETSI